MDRRGQKQRLERYRITSMEQKSVSRLEIINDLEDIIEEIRSGEYPAE